MSTSGSESEKEIDCTPPDLRSEAKLAMENLLPAKSKEKYMKIRSSFSSVSRKLRSMKGVTLHVANKVYIKEGAHELQPRLAADAAGVFDAGFEKVDFADGAAAADLINKWVESKTNNKIKAIVSSDIFDDKYETRLILVNATYFKGCWENPFNASNTKHEPFHIDADTTVNVPMMHARTEQFLYGNSKHLDAQLLEMPYEGGQASMVFVLPNKVNGLNDVLVKLADGHHLLMEVENLRTRRVFVSIPKFKIESEIDLTRVLPKMGIKAIFKPHVSGLDKMIMSKESLFVSDAVQKAIIEVNEEGTEAAAVTRMRFEPQSMPPRFVANRPFLYLLNLKNSQERTVLFVGVYRGDVPAASAST